MKKALETALIVAFVLIVIVAGGIVFTFTTDILLPFYDRISPDITRRNIETDGMKYQYASWYDADGLMHRGRVGYEVDELRREKLVFFPTTKWDITEIFVYRGDNWHYRREINGKPFSFEFQCHDTFDRDWGGVTLRCTGNETGGTVFSPKARFELHRLLGEGERRLRL